MFGHVKAYCKNEIKRSICGEDAHRECNKYWLLIGIVEEIIDLLRGIVQYY